MSDKLKAVDDIKKLSKFLKGLAEFGEQLESMGSLENAEQETKNRLVKLQAEESAMKASIEALKVLQSINENGAMVEMNDIKAKQEKMIEEHKVKAAQILADAESNAAAMIAGGNNQLKQIEIEMASVKSEIASARIQLAAETEKLEGVKLAIKKITGAV